MSLLAYYNVLYVTPIVAQRQGVSRENFQTGDGLELPSESGALVGAIQLLASVASVSCESGWVWDVVVHSRLGGDHGVTSVALLDESQGSSIDASVVTGVKDVVTNVVGVRGDVLEVRIGCISGKKAPSITQDCLDDETSIMQFTGVASGNVGSGAKYPELDSIGFPPRFLEGVLSVACITAVQIS